MWIFGHLGIGSRIARPLARGLPLGWLMVGTILPDLIDKPLFMIAGLIEKDPSVRLISSTRTFGHTGILLVSILLYSIVRRSRTAAALALGAATHAVLDGLQDAVNLSLFEASGESSVLLALLYPFYKPHFAPYPFRDLHEHAGTLFNPLVIVAEMLGVLIVYRDLTRARLFKKTKNSGA